MALYTYPAVFLQEEKGAYSVDFPDLENCYTCGDDLKDALWMAEDVLAMTLYRYERENREIPKPSKEGDIKTDALESVKCISADTNIYHEKFGD